MKDARIRKEASEHSYGYWVFMHKSLNVFGKWTPAVYAVVLFIVAFWFIMSLVIQLNTPITYGTPPAYGASQAAPESHDATHTASPSQEVLKQRFLASYEDTVPGNDAAWLDWAWTTAKGMCKQLDSGDTLSNMRTSFAQDKNAKYLKIVSTDAILVVCPSHIDQLPTPAIANTIQP